MALVSPGVEVTIIDQSQYLPAPPASVPLIIMATAQNKPDPSGTAIAPGTLAANANKLYRVTSQRDLVSFFGTPYFYKTTDGTAIQGYELNEYGLFAAYSVLGTSNLCYVIRANINLAAYIGQTGRPSAPPVDGSYWLNTTTSTWGMFQFNASTGSFSVISPIVIEDVADVSGSNSQPQQYIGNIGDYAMVLTDQYGSPSSYYTYWFKNSNNEWVVVGGLDWKNSWPTVQGTATPTTVTPGIFIINGTSITVVLGSNDTVDGVVGSINGSNILGVTAQNVDGRLQIFQNNGTTVVIAAGGSPTPSAATLTSLGITPKTYYSPSFVYGTNAQQPLWKSTDSQPHPTGSVWVKTNSPNLGTNIVISKYSAATATYSAKSCPLSTSDWVISNSLDSSGGQAIAAGSVYAQYGFNGESSIAPLQLFQRSSIGDAVFVGTNTSPTFDSYASFTVSVSAPSSSSLSGPYTVTLPISGSVDASDFVTAWASANIPYTTAQVSSTGAIVLTHTEGGVIIMDDADGTQAVLIGTVPTVGLDPQDTLDTAFPSAVIGNLVEDLDTDDLWIYSGSSWFIYNVPASAVTEAGFTINTDVTTPTGCVGAKWGPFKTINYSPDFFPTTHLTGIGIDCELSVSTTGYVPTFTVETGGVDYAVGDLLEVTGGGYLTDPYIVQVTEVGALNAAVEVQWYANVATPQYSVQLSNWRIFNYTPNLIAPVSSPADGTPWYYSVVNQVDIMTNVGGVWTGYKNISYASDGLPQSVGTPSTDPAGPIISATAPTVQSDNSVLVYGDLWIDTSDLENYPVISRWQNVNGEDQWVLIDNTDQTTENGILFQDARWATNGTTNPIDDPIPTIVSLLTSNYLDIDAPNAQLYPQGTLLFNTRRSGYNVKEFMVNYFNATSFPDAVLPEETNAWVSVSGLQTNGAPYMGRSAQRSMIVKALKTTVDTSTQLRDEDTFFNLMATPQYPELQPNMVTLNNDRGQTAYIIGDTPLRLVANGQAIFDWTNNTAGASSTGEQGLVTRNTYLGIYYPSGITNDLTGTQVVVPSSHMILRTMIYNDTVAYPWFAPAGQRRGIIDNATNIGYIDPTTGEFVADKNNVGLRDIEYQNFINPITSFTNIGLLNYGNKNSFDSSSALDRTNVARLVNYLRDRLAKAVSPFLFEPNDNLTRTQVRAICQTLLADILAKRGLYDYLVVCDTSNNTPARIDRNELWIDIAIEPVKAVEFIYIPIRILNTGEIAGLVTNG